MNTIDIRKNLNILQQNFEGEIHSDQVMRILYSTDASDYKEMPLAVVFPKNENDIQLLVNFANSNKTSLIPRTAGTSLAGQVVGNGIVVDVSKYMTKILELNKEEKWVKVQPGVVLDELNIFLKPHNLFFGPETSTSNRCMIGGMVGNNSCGAHSLIYKTTRDHTLELRTILSDGSIAEFKNLNRNEFLQKLKLNNLEGEIYRNTQSLLNGDDTQLEIRNEFPDKTIYRRNTGYAVDLLLDCLPITTNGLPFNFCKILAGSEGTLAFFTEIKLNLVTLPPKEVGVVAAHFHSLNDALRANIIALQFQPGAVELMDETIMNCTKNSRAHSSSRFFIKDEPKAMLMIEFERHTKEEIEAVAKKMEAAIRNAGYGYHFPILFGNDTKKVWNLRKAGLGLLANVPGDKKSVTVIEDTAVDVNVLPDFVVDFQKTLDKYGLECVFYAHVGSGELHLRPMLNLKDANDRELFYTIGKEIALLVKKYKGSLSGEHGDGRLRGEFIPIIIGEKNYQLLKEIKKVWDVNNIFNPNKIVDAPSMKENLKYKLGETPHFETVFNFSKEQGFVRAAEKCTGSADCRKSEIIGGAMCPSFMATRNEKDSTRARANILRDILNNSTNSNPFNSKEIYEVMDLCLSCKACKKECPSGVDVAKLKAEFLQHYYEDNKIPLRTKLIANQPKMNKLASFSPAISNFFMKNSFFSKQFMKFFNFSEKRKMPLLYKTTLEKWYRKNFAHHEKQTKGTVYFFNDEFTNFNDTSIGIIAIQLLTHLGYKVIIPKHEISGRTFLSKGLLHKAKKIVNTNLELLGEKISAQTPLLGIEPSAILSFRDEYPDLANSENKEKAENLAKNSFLVQEFLWQEVEKGNITKELFTNETAEIKLHGHCQQKALAGTETDIKLLSLPENYSVKEIPSGCCGMAGSFGYEKEHYAISMKIGELVLFPAVRKTDNKTIIAAVGTSCRHQIFDGTGRVALHPVEILWNALKKTS